MPTAIHLLFAIPEQVKGGQPGRSSEQHAVCLRFGFGGEFEQDRLGTHCNLFPIHRLELQVFYV
jgi:hypothetical protein